jgi:hypothetical protein
MHRNSGCSRQYTPADGAGAADAPEMPVDTDYQRTVSAAPNVLGKAQ